MEGLINIGIILTHIMIGFAALTAVSFGVKKILSNTKNAKKTLYTILGLVVVCVASYVFASDEVLQSYEKYKISATESKNVGMGLIMFYTLATLAVGAILYSELSKAFSK
jgi:polyferredoxin